VTPAVESRITRTMPTRLRLPLLATVLALLALALGVAGCGGSNGMSGDKGDSGDAKALLEKGFAKKVRSGDLKVDFKATLEGSSQIQGPIAASLSGPFESNGQKKLPILDWSIRAEGAGQSLQAGLKLTNDNAFVEYRGQSYEVGTQLFSKLADQFANRSADKDGQSLEQFGIDPARWLKDPKVEDGDDIGGDPTRKVTGSVDVERAVRDVLQALRSPALKKQLQSQGQTVPNFPRVSDEDVNKVSDAIKDLRFEANVDDNGYARRLFAEAGFDVPEDSQAGGVKGGKVSFGYVLDKVGGTPDVKAPDNPQPITVLLQQLGLGGTLGGLPLQQ
jgi:hypothetical protein